MSTLVCITVCAFFPHEQISGKCKNKFSYIGQSATFLDVASREKCSNRIETKWYVNCIKKVEIRNMRIGLL